MPHSLHTNFWYHPTMEYHHQCQYYLHHTNGSWSCNSHAGQHRHYPNTSPRKEAKGEKKAAMLQSLIPSHTCMFNAAHRGTFWGEGGGGGGGGGGKGGTQQVIARAHMQSSSPVASSPDPLSPDPLPNKKIRSWLDPTSPALDCVPVRISTSQHPQ